MFSEMLTSEVKMEQLSKYNIQPASFSQSYYLKNMIISISSIWHKIT